MSNNWGVFRQGFAKYVAIFIPFTDEKDGVLMSRWDTKPEAKECAERMTQMDEHAAAVEAGQQDLPFGE
jgi:hypothetical protein